MLSQNADPQFWPVYDPHRKCQRTTPSEAESSVPSGVATRPVVAVLPSTADDMRHLRCEDVDVVILFYAHRQTFEDWDRSRRLKGWLCLGPLHEGLVTGAPSAFTRSANVRTIASEARAGKKGYSITADPRTALFEHCQHHILHMKKHGLYGCCANQREAYLLTLGLDVAL